MGQGGVGKQIVVGIGGVLYHLIYDTLEHSMSYTWRGSESITVWLCLGLLAMTSHVWFVFVFVY